MTLAVQLAESSVVIWNTWDCPGLCWVTWYFCGTFSFKLRCILSLTNIRANSCGSQIYRVWHLLCTQVKCIHAQFTCANNADVWFDVRKWFKVEVISNVLEPVRDVAFSPNLGRSYHMIAVASKDVHIFSLKPLTRFQPRCFIFCVNSTCAECIFTHLCHVWL